jgi:hypothetical protein
MGATYAGYHLCWYYRTYAVRKGTTFLVQLRNSYINDICYLIFSSFPDILISGKSLPGLGVIFQASNSAPVILTR